MTRILRAIVVLAAAAAAVPDGRGHRRGLRRPDRPGRRARGRARGAHLPRPVRGGCHQNPAGGRGRRHARERVAAPRAGRAPLCGGRYGRRRGGRPLPALRPLRPGERRIPGAGALPLRPVRPLPQAAGPPPVRSAAPHPLPLAERPELAGPDGGRPVGKRAHPGGLRPGLPLRPAAARPDGNPELSARRGGGHLGGGDRRERRGLRHQVGQGLPDRRGRRRPGRGLPEPGAHRADVSALSGAPGRG